MTVQELIAKLTEFPPDARVLVRDPDGNLVPADDVDLVNSQYSHWAGVKSGVYVSGTM